MNPGGGHGPWAGTLAATATVSLALHAGGLELLSRLEPRRTAPERPVEVDFEAVTPPPPPPRVESARPEPRPPEPAAPRRIAVARLARAPPDAKPPPPPPNEPPPPGAPRARAVPLTGLSLSSTVESGAFAVTTGNTFYGKAPGVAPDPEEVKPYAAEGTAPPSRRSAQPRLLEQPEVPYPAEARRAGLEGKVKLLLHLDRQGRVVSARILADPGGGLGEAARAGALRFRFSPGQLDGEPVEVPDFPYTYTFVLE